MRAAHKTSRGDVTVRSVLLWAAAIMMMMMAHLTAAATTSTDPESQLRLAAGETLQRNLHLSQLVVYPSPAYYNPYLRDSFWTAQAVGNRRLALSVLDQFVAAERSDGEPPTYFVNAYSRPIYHSDESASLVLVWAWRNKLLYGLTPPRALLQRSLDYLLRHARNGRQITPRGRYASWWDSYNLPSPDTLSYTQGLFAVALRCASLMGLNVPATAVSGAEAAYRSLYDSRLGYVRLSANIAATDASALTGEFLSLWLFRRPILLDAQVRSTIDHLTAFGAGFRVVTFPHGHGADAGYLPTSDAGVAGDYQNGASWLLYDALTIAAAGLHGVIDGRSRLRARLRLEFSHGVLLHEYLQTEPSLTYYGSEPPSRDYFSWDTFVLVIADVLRTHAATSYHDSIAAHDVANTIASGTAMIGPGRLAQVIHQDASIVKSVH